MSRSIHGQPYDGNSPWPRFNLPSYSMTIDFTTIDAVKKIMPSKPIRYVLNTHLHFDHAGGLRTYAAEGATIVTHHDNIPFYEQVWANPRTINPDRLAKSGRKPVFEGVGMLMLFLPKEKILIEADSFSPPANPNVPPPALATLIQFYDAVERLRLDVEQVVPIHGRLTTLGEVRTVIERYRSIQLFGR